jgi:hypothetical protein
MYIVPWLSHVVNLYSQVSFLSLLLSNSDFTDSSMCRNDTLYPEQNTISYSDGRSASRQTYSDTLTTQYNTTNSSRNNDVHSNNTHSLTSRSSTTQRGHPSYGTLPLTRQALAQHDVIHTSAVADKRTRYSTNHPHRPRTVRPYVGGGRAYSQDKHRTIHGAHKRSSISAKHVINHPYPTTIYEADINDQERQVNFGHEERVIVRDIQAEDCPSVSGNFHDIGAQFEFFSL